MSIREVVPINNSFIKKYISFDRKIPYLTGTYDLEKHKNLFKKEEYVSLYQQFTELEIFEECSREERQLLAPIVNIEYSKNNAPVLTFPNFSPLLTPEKAVFLSEEDSIAYLQNEFSIKGYEDNEIGKFLESIIHFCDEYNLVLDDCLFNLSNIGYNEIFGFRLIDYGLTNELMETFNEAKNYLS